MKTVSEPPITKFQEKKRTIIRYFKISLAAFLSLLVWGLYFIGKTTEFIGDLINEMKGKLNEK